MIGAPKRSEFTLLPAEDAWAAEVASRLRLILASGADESDDARSLHLEEEVRRSLQAINQGQRGHYLSALKRQFPTEAGAPSSARAATAAAPKVETPEDVMNILTGAWGTFSADQRRALREQLVESGIVEVAAAAPGEVAEFPEVKQRMGLAPTEPLVNQRVGKLLVQEAEFLIKLDQMIWNTWKTLAPRSLLKREGTLGDLRLQLRRYLKGDAEPTDLQIAQQIERSRQLIAILVGSLSQIGNGYVKRHQTRYSPDAIRDLVKMEGGGGFGFDAKCWRKYTDLASEINDATIQNEMVEIVVKYVEELMKGMTKPAAGSPAS